MFIPIYYHAKFSMIHKIGISNSLINYLQKRFNNKYIILKTKEEQGENLH